MSFARRAAACARLCAGALSSRGPAGPQASPCFASASRAVAALLEADRFDTRFPRPGGYSTLPHGARAALASLGAAEEGAAHSVEDSAEQKPGRGRPLGARDENGLSILDPRTVAFLVEKGIMGGDKAAVERLMRRREGSTWPFERACPAYEWLEGVLEAAEQQTRKRNGVPMPIVRQTVEMYPQLLWRTLTRCRAVGTYISRRRARAAWD